MASFHGASLATRRLGVKQPQPHRENRPIDRAVENTSQSVDSYILIGPEGGLAPEEIELALSSGYQAASLGAVTLRVETAAVAACSIVSLLRGYE